MLKVKKNYRNEIIFFVLMALICFMFFCFGKKKVLAENVAIKVDNFEGLQDALSNANQDTEIIVSQTINLSSNVSLDGHGATVRVEKPYVNADGKVGSGYSNYGVFIINGNINIRNMKIMGGSNNGGEAEGTLDNEFAALQVQSGIANMENVKITRSGRGISIRNGANVILSDSQIVRNAYAYGGGIYCKGKLIMNNCSFSENRTVYHTGGGAMEINGGELYANNTIIINNASREVGGAINCLDSKIYLINCTITGNVTTRNRDDGGAIGLNNVHYDENANRGNELYAANCIFVNNYHIDQENDQIDTSDISIQGNGSDHSLYLYNCLYNNIVKSYSADDSQKVKTVGCKTETEAQNVATAYRDDGIFLSKDEFSPGFIHPAATAKPDTDGLGLYIPIQEQGLAVTGGTSVYFDFSDLSNIKMGLNSNGNMLALGSLNLPSETSRVPTYYEGINRSTDIIGASGIDGDDYYTVKLGNYANGSVEGATFYGDTYKKGTSVTVKAIENVNGYVFKKWTLVSDAGDEEIITDNPYNFVVNSDVILIPEFVEGYRYYVVFDGNGATSGEMDEVSFISDLGIDRYLPENVFSRKGYEFIGWNTESDGTGTSYENQAKIVANLTDSANDQVILYAQWKPNEYKIKFDGNGATSGKMGETSFIFDTEGHLPENIFSRTNYSFVGWNTEPDGTGTSYADKAKIKNLTDVANDFVILYAQWQKNKNDDLDDKIPDVDKKNIIDYHWTTIENSGGNNLIEKHNDMAKIESEVPNKLQTRKYLIGYPEGTMQPDKYLTKAEFATVIYRLMNDGETINYDKLKNIGVEKSDWFAKAVAYLISNSKGIIDLDEKQLNPNAKMNSTEMLKIIYDVLKSYGVDKNLIDAQDLNTNITRAKMSKIIFNVFERKSNPGQKSYSDLDDKHWAYNFLMDASE